MNAFLLDVDFCQEIPVCFRLFYMPGKLKTMLPEVVQLCFY